MRSRILTLLLIAAVVACPMQCGSGVCFAGDCCPPTGSQLSCEQHGTNDICCEESQPEDDRAPEPQRCPGEQSCQGVCGGAVFEKPVKKLDTTDSLVLQLDSDLSLGTSLIECRTANLVEPKCHHPGGNHGRSLRTLHMSLLC